MLCPTCGNEMKSIEQLFSSTSPEPWSFEAFIQWEPIYWCESCGTLFYNNDSQTTHAPLSKPSHAFACLSLQI